MKCHTILTVLIVGLFVAASASADIVHLKSGGSVTVKATRTDKYVVVETVAGEGKIRLADVDRIDFEHESTIEKYYGLKARAEAKPDFVAYLEVARWSLENKAIRYVKPNVEKATALLESEKDPAAVLKIAEEFEKGLGDRLAPVWSILLRLDPQSESARRALGCHRLEDRWITEEEFQVAQGNVLFEDEWMTPARRELIEKERAAGFAKREKALARAEKKVTQREGALAKDQKKVEKVKRELTAQPKEQARERRRLDDLDKELRKRESFLRSLRICRTCRNHFTGTHICPVTWQYCRQCSGYFGRRHSCPR